MKILQWYLYRRWTPRVCVAIRRCRADKGYVAALDWLGIRDGSHWSLREDTARVFTVREPRTQRVEVVPIYWD